MIKYRNRYRLKVSQNSPDLLFFAPNKKAALFYAEMCGFNVISISKEK